MSVLSPAKQENHKHFCFVSEGWIKILIKAAHFCLVAAETQRSNTGLKHTINKSSFLTPADEICQNLHIIIMLFYWSCLFMNVILFINVFIPSSIMLLDSLNPPNDATVESAWLFLCFQRQLCNSTLWDVTEGKASPQR